MRTITLPKYEDIEWYHEIELPDERITPGRWPAHFKKCGMTEIDFKGKRVLDIGCLNGLYSFYTEQRGASEVISIDIATEEFKGYLYAHEQLKSKAKYMVPYSVYRPRI